MESKYDALMKDYNATLDMCFHLFYRIKELDLENRSLNLKLGTMHTNFSSFVKELKARVNADYVDGKLNNNKGNLSCRDIDEILKVYKNGK